MRKFTTTLLITLAFAALSITSAIAIRGMDRVIPVIALPDIIDTVMPSVVHISAEAGWQGSGFALTEDIIVTARHCVRSGEKFTIITSDGMEFDAVEAIESNEYDVGFIKVKPSEIAKMLGIKQELRPVELGDITDCRLGQQVFKIGSSYGKINFNSVSLGIISSLRRSLLISDRIGGDYGWSILFQTDTEGMGGDSGCPIFTMDGKVIGVWVGSIQPAVHYGIPVLTFMDDIENIKLLFLLDKYKINAQEPITVEMQ